MTDNEQLVRLHNDPAIPEWLARLKCAILERLPTDEAHVWHGSFTEAITPLGVDLEPIRHKLAILRIDRLIALQTHALEKHHAHGVHEAISKVLTALHQVRRCHEAELQGQVCDLAAAGAAARSAGDAAWSAARAAAGAAGDAVESAAESAARAAWSDGDAAWSAAWSAAESAARAAESAAGAAESAAGAARAAAAAAESAAWKQEADDLIELLQEAKA